VGDGTGGLYWAVTIGLVRAVVQRVSRATVTVDGSVVAAIGHGLCVLVGVAIGDTVGDAVVMADKLAGLRILPDADGKMNVSVDDAGGEVMIVSQFTLLGDVSRGRRPSFIEAARPEQAEPLVLALARRVAEAGIPVSQGVFGADMEVELVNDGPVTLVLEVRQGSIC
jgi:D-tyrosyl-tRNA(Tyr) deacylase